MAIATAAQIKQVAQLYTALFNRAPDTAGLSFWSNAIANGASLSTVTQGFLNAPEGVAQYPQFQSATDFITAFYTKVFGRAPDAGGLAFWTAALGNQGGAESAAAKAAVAAQIIAIVSTPLSAADAALPANAQTVTDRAIFANKVEIGTYLATNSVVTVDSASTFAGVTADAASIEPLKAAVFAGAIAGSGTPTVYGNVIGTAGDNIFTATLTQATQARTIDGAAGNDTLNVTAVGTATATTFNAATITGIETIKLSGATTGSVVDAAKFVGSTSIVIDGAAGTVALNNMTGKSVGLSGTGTAAVVTANYSATDTTAAIVLSGASTGNSLTLVGDKLASASITGSGAVTLTVQPAALKTVNVNSTSGTIDLTATAATGVTTIDASASTGAVKASIGATVAYKGGAGVDTVTIGAAPQKLLDGGAGTNDTIVIASNTDVLIASAGNLTGFETLTIGTGNAGTYSAAAFSNILLSQASGATVFTNVAANTALTISAAQTSATYTLADATGTADVLKLTLSNEAQFAAGTVTAAGIETVNVINTDTNATVNTGANTLTLSAAAAKSIVVTGNTGLDITATLSTAVTSFDATGLTISSATAAGVTYTSLNATVGAAVSIKGALTGVNTLVGNAANDTIVGGAGADSITAGTGLDVLTGGAGNDTFILNARNANQSIYATITDFAKGDKIDVSAIAQGTLANAATLTKVGLAAGTFAQFVAAASAGAGGTDALASWFQSDGNTYIVIDNSAGATFVEGTDQLVKLTGLVDLSTASITTGEVITIA